MRRKIKRIYRRFTRYCKNKVNQLWDNRESIQATVSRMFPLITTAIILAVVIRIVVLIGTFIRSHCVELIVVGFFLFVSHRYDKKWREKRTKGNEKANVVSMSVKKTLKSPNEIEKIIAIAAYKFGILRSQTSSLILLYVRIFSIDLPTEIYMVGEKTI